MAKLKLFFGLAIVAHLLAGVASSALAQRSAPSFRTAPQQRAKPCPNGRHIRVAVAQIRDARTLVLSDGQVVTLKGLQPPDVTDVPGAGANGWPLAQSEIARLRSDLVGTNITIIFAGRRDRYGRRPVHAFTGNDRSANGDWLQAELIRSGRARFNPESLRTACAETLFELEQTARRAKVGLWSLAAYAVRSARRPDLLMRLRNTFQIVEGKVVSAKSVRGKIFLNFGRDWRQDFTAAISKRQLRYFKRRGWDPLSLKGRRIRVRGWIERYGGPFIDIRHTHQIEVIGGWKRRPRRSRRRPQYENRPSREGPGGQQI